jgi:hypothetical protein
MSNDYDGCGECVDPPSIASITSHHDDGYLGDDPMLPSSPSSSCSNEHDDEGDDDNSQ